MNYIEDINEFIDGELPIEKEEEFFQEIARNSEFRQNFKTLFAMSSAVKSNNIDLKPSLDVKDNLFKALNIKDYSKIDNHIRPDNFFSKMINLIVTNRKIIITSAISCLATILMILYFFPGIFLQNSFRLNVFSLKRLNNLIFDNHIKKEINFTKNSNRTDFSNLKRNNVANEVKTEQFAVNEKVKPKDIMKSKIEFKINKISIPRCNIVVNNDMPYKPSFENINLFKNVYSNPGFKIPNKFSLEMRTLYSWYLQKNILPGNNLPALKNIAISAIYNLSNSIAIGAGIRNESFGISEINHDEYNNKIFMVTEKNMNHYHLFFRFSSKADDYFYPVGQISFGSAASNFVFGVMSGFEYEISQDFSINCFVDYNALIYLNGNQNLTNSQKIGINYGIRYKFFKD